MKRDLIEKIEQMTKDSYLRGFCGFINNDIDKLIEGKPFLIVVNDHKSVDLISEIDAEKKRTILVSARINEKLREFPFGSFLTQEEFAIAFRSLFKQKKGDDFDYVLSYASKLVGGTQIEGDDDGITQKVGIRRGLSGTLKDKVDLKPIVKLNDVPTVALFEADGGAWANQATENIVTYIQSLVTDIPVIA